MKSPIPPLLVFTSINVLVSSTPGITLEEQECLDDKKVWQSKTRSCKTCKSCSYGEGRNFTDMTTIRRKGSGDMRCPPCTTCPKGFYNKRKDAVTCARCVKNCTDRYHRNVQAECTNLQDNTCGACLPGYSDPYHNVDFPCMKDAPTSKLVRVTQEPYKHSPKSNNKVERPTKNNTAFRVEPSRYEALPKQSLDFKPMYITAIVVAGLLTLVVIAVAVYLKKPNRTRRNSRGEKITRVSNSLDIDSTQTTGPGYAPRSSDRLVPAENDLEMDNPDAVRKENVGRRVANYFRQCSDDGKASLRVHHTYENSSNVRAENINSLTTSGPSQQHFYYHTEQYKRRSSCEDRELSFGVQSVPDAIPPFQWSRSERIGTKCKCVTNLSCTCCSSINTGPRRVLARSDPVFNTVAALICHEPTPLFHGLGIPDPDIYQIDNDRDRDPERISVRETVIKLLHTWVERQPGLATFQTLCTELCKANFHCITKKLIEDLDSPR